jgi:hypothetical protein
MAETPRRDQNGPIDGTSVSRNAIIFLKDRCRTVGARETHGIFIVASTIAWAATRVEIIMDKDLAKHIATVTFGAMSELTGLVPFLKQHCDPSEYEEYAKAIASVAGFASSELLQKIFSAQPEIEQEFDAKIAKYGKLI